MDLCKRRRRGRPKLTFREIHLGSFLENLELQVRDAVLRMNKKGYLTWSSGFYGENADMQGIDGPFVLSKETKVKLIAAGAMVDTGGFMTRYVGRTYTHILFHPVIPDTRSIIREWRKLLSLIPAKGHCAPLLPENYSSAEFRERYASRKRKIKTR